jgi:CheY-like chemotaxis protein
LLVEDEMILALTEKSNLEQYGYAVMIANCGEKAVEIVASNLGIDLVLMDIDLGKGMDGTQAAEKILSGNDLPIVFLSSHTESGIVEKTEKNISYG